MNRAQRFVAVSVLGLVTIAPAAHAREGGFIGLDVGVSEPTNDNYRGHVKTGVSGSPFGGYMFNDYLGLQGQFQAIGQPPDDDKRRFSQSNINNETQWTTLLGLTAGPRLQIPLGDLVDLYATGQGGGFKGVSGRLNQWAPGFSVGGGIDFNVSDNVSIGVFGRWNRAYMAPHPYCLGATSGPNGGCVRGNVYPQSKNEQGPNDAQWAVGGVSFKYSFGEEEAPPPPPAPVAKATPAPPPPVAKKKIVLRNVYFDFNKDSIRGDAKPVLDEAVKILKNETTEAVICEGHTDSKGTDAYNMGLSKRRAGSVKQYLVRGGIPASRVRTDGFGESRPVASNDTEDGRSQNRRVELHLD